MQSDFWFRSVGVVACCHGGFSMLDFHLVLSYAVLVCRRHVSIVVAMVVLSKLLQTVDTSDHVLVRL